MRFLVSVLFLFFSFLSFSQQEINQEKENTLLIYKNIEQRSNQYSVSKYVYKYIFVPPSLSNQTKPDSNAIDVLKITNKANNELEGKIIRTILINKNPPNLSVSEKSNFQKGIANHLASYTHLQTRSFVVRNLLLFKENEKFDSLLIQESERLIRKQRHIEKCSIIGVSSDVSSDSVDVIIEIKDVFSLMPEADFSSSKYSLGFREINVLGLGHRFQTSFLFGMPNIFTDYDLNYYIPNIYNTYVNAEFSFKKNVIDSSYNKKIAIERPFYSAVTKWSGGFYFSEESYLSRFYSSFFESSSVERINKNTQDVWIAKAINLNERKTNLVFSARYLNSDYEKKINPQYDPFNVYVDETFYLASIAYSHRNYQKQKNIFKFGFDEDVPVGRSISLIAGIRHKNQQNKPYLASKISQGRFLSSGGFFSSHLEFGSFFNQENIFQGVFTAESRYFTPLIDIGNWSFRQFVKPEFTIGINRLNNESLTLDGFWGLRTSSKEKIIGTQKILCSFQSQFYSPCNWKGFLFAPYFVYSFGAIASDRKDFSTSKVYSMFGLGILIRNDYLLFNSFEISLSFIPFLPGNEMNIFKLNSYETSNFGLRDYKVEKPSTIKFK